MKTMPAIILALLATTAQAFASSGAAESEDLSMLAIGFISFGVLIILFQFVPALLLIGGMVAGLFKAGEKKNGKDLASADKTS
jgi:hypothetical protein